MEITRLCGASYAKIIVRLNNSKKNNDFVSKMKADSFVVTNKNGMQTEVPYSDVRRAKRQDIPLGAKIGIAAAIFIGGTFLVGSLLKN